MNNEFIKKIADAGVIAYAATTEKALAMAEAGVGAIETDSLEVLSALRAARPELCLGYLGKADAADCAAAGADFIHAPVYCKSCARAISEAGLSLIACISTPLEAEKALDMGADVLDLVNADLIGGVAMLGAISLTVKEAKFIISGAKAPLDYTVIPACIGWTDASISEAEDTYAAAREAMYASLGLTLAHIGINAENEASSIEISEAYAKLLGLKQKTGNSSCFAGSLVEVMKTKYLGEHGHIAIGTRSLPRAIAFYNRIGVPFNMSTAKPVAIYFADEIGGFAIHLVQK